MKKVFLLLIFIGIGAVAQDDKDASSDKATIADGILRDSKPFAQKKLSNGAMLSIWTNPLYKTTVGGRTIRHLVKASATLETPKTADGFKSVKAEFLYNNGKLANSSYKETNVIQRPTPQVTTNTRTFIYTDGVRNTNSETVTETEKFMDETAIEIEKLYQSHVNK